MPKLKTNSMEAISSSAQDELSKTLVTQEDELAEDWSLPPLHKRIPRLVRWSLWLAVFAGGLGLASNLFYSGKAFPGVSVDGTKIAGLSRDAAIVAATQHVATFQGQLIPVSDGAQTVQISTDKLAITYDIPAAVDAAMAYGRNGSFLHRAYEQLRALVGRSTNVAAYNFSDDALTPYLDQIDSDTNSPVTEASLNISGNSVTVDDSKVGRQLNTGELIMAIENHIANTSLDPITAPVAPTMPLVDTASLQSVKDTASQYVAGPITLHSPTPITITQDQIVSWIKVTRPISKTFDQTLNVAYYYSLPQPVVLVLDKAAITKYVADLAAKTDQATKNAAVSMNNGVLAVTEASHNGLALDQAGTLASIESALTKPATDRDITLDIKVTQADVNEGNLASLGIKDLISEGASTFPGSVANRITNIQVGTSKFVDVLVKPGDTFSFDSYLGDIDAAHGWKPGLSIIGNKIIPEYGGGICQVSSTVYRAALLAGLPITARTNHAYAISWYTAPFGVPGVDATIYAPDVDLKFTNDTGAYILIQPVLDVANSSLKFDFYGTKTKVGAIRGPFFVTGSNDATKPATTVFYRDIQDLAGKVIKTDTVTTHYASSLDFTHVTLD